MPIDFELARHAMVEQQVRPWEVLDPRVLDALKSSQTVTAQHAIAGQILVIDDNASNRDLLTRQLETHTFAETSGIRAVSGGTWSSSNESIAWSSRNREINPSVSGTAQGFDGLRQGLGLDVVPSMAIARRRRFGPNGFTENNYEPQLDVFYKLTPQLNASLTINTDFSATEVDDRVVNLTRFNLFFPERRDFFIRDSDIFQFGRIGNGTLFGQEGNEAIPTSALQNGRPFFSRNIGLSTTGAQVDIDAGDKQSGRGGRSQLSSSTFECPRVSTASRPLSSFGPWILQ